jgi:hypothetical protein
MTATDTREAPATVADDIRRAASEVRHVDPAEIARQRRLGWPEIHPEDFCHRCGNRNLSWYVDSDLWNRVMRGPDGDDRHNVVCPPCFARLAAEIGVDCTWELVPDGRTFADSEAALRALLPADQCAFCPDRRTVGWYFDDVDDDGNPVTSTVCIDCLRKALTGLVGRSPTAAGRHRRDAAADGGV